MVDLTPLPIASSFRSSTTAAAAGSNLDAHSSNIPRDLAPTASFKEMLAGLQSSDPASSADSDPAANSAPGTVAETSPKLSISSSLPALKVDSQAQVRGDRVNNDRASNDRLSNDQSSIVSTRPTGSTSSGYARGPFVGYAAGVGATVSSLSQIAAATQETATQETATQETASLVNQTSDTAENTDDPAKTKEPAITALADSAVAESVVRGVVPAIGKVNASPAQMAGERSQNSEPLRKADEGNWAGEETTGSQSAGTEIIGNSVSASGADALKRKKKADDLVSRISNSNPTTSAGGAAFLPIITPALLNGASGITGRTAAVSGSNRQTSAANADDSAAALGLKSNSIAAGNPSASDFAFAVRFKSDAAAQNSNSVASGGSDDSGSRTGADANGKALPQTQTSSGSAGTEWKSAPPVGSNLAGSNLNVSNLNGVNLSSPNATGLGGALSIHRGGQAESGMAADPAVVANSSGADETKPAGESAAPALRSVQLQITGQDNQRVDVKLIERPGALSMSVRAADGSLTRSLQEHLPELTTKLAEQQMPAEWWVPKTSAAGPVSETSSASGDTTKQGDSRSQGQTGSGGQDSGSQDSGRQGGRQDDQPNWVDELAAMNNSKSNRKEYIWHQ